MRAALFALLLGCASTPPSSGPSPAEAPGLAVWIDVDTAAGVPHRDVDDAVALVQAFHSPELAVRGISVVFGNTSLELAVPIAREVTRRFGPHGVAVHVGAASAGQLGQSTAATDALIAALEAEPLTLLVLGPATNVASVLKLRPDLAPRIEQLIAVAGRRPGQRFTTGTTNPKGHRDFNFEQDPDAFATLLDAGVPLVFAPWEISSTVWITDAELARWAAGSPASRWLAAAAPSWIGLWKDVFAVPGFNPFDTLAIAVLTHPDLVQCSELPMHILEGPDDVTAEPLQGAPVKTKPYLVVDEAASGPTVRYCHTADPGFAQVLTERLVQGH